MAQLYGKKTSDGLPKALECTDDGMLKVDTELTATIDPTGLASEATAGDIKTAVEALAVELSEDLVEAEKAKKEKKAEPAKSTKKTAKKSK